MTSTPASIIACCESVLRSDPKRYQASLFREKRLGALIAAARSVAVGEPIKKSPGPLSLRVSDRNTAETAYQRALYSGRTAVVHGMGAAPWRATWLDIELPITAKPRTSRCRTVDLIGRLAAETPFLWELIMRCSRCSSTSPS